MAAAWREVLGLPQEQALSVEANWFEVKSAAHSKDLHKGSSANLLQPCHVNLMHSACSL